MLAVDQLTNRVQYIRPPISPAVLPTEWRRGATMRSDRLHGAGLDLDVLGLGHEPQHGLGDSM